MKDLSDSFSIELYKSSINGPGRTAVFCGPLIVIHLSYAFTNAIDAVGYRSPAIA